MYNRVTENFTGNRGIPKSRIPYPISTSPGERKHSGCVAGHPWLGVPFTCAKIGGGRAGPALLIFYATMFTGNLM
jgi:hypothetical protein